MEKYQVLVPVDGSAFSKQIVPVLTKFLNPEWNELILLRVGEPVGGMLGAPPRPAGLDGRIMSYESERDARHAAHPIFASQVRESAVAEFLAEGYLDVRALERAGFTVHSEVRFGNPGEEIVNYARTHNVDLIAMTTHWRTGVTKLLYGNTVQYVTPRVSAPLLMLRPTDAFDVSNN